MTVPEENREKTETTDPVVSKRTEAEDERKGEEGRSMREALDDAGVTPEDYEE